MVRILDKNVEVLIAENFIDFQFIPGFRNGRRKGYPGKVRANAQNSFDAADHHGGSCAGQPVNVGTPGMFAGGAFSELSIAVGF